MLLEPSFNAWGVEGLLAVIHQWQLCHFLTVKGLMDLSPKVCRS